jgi:hypothetical protein
LAVYLTEINNPLAKAASVYLEQTGATEHAQVTSRLNSQPACFPARRLERLVNLFYVFGGLFELPENP